MKRNRLWLVCGAAATVGASYWVLAGEIDPPKGAVQPTMNSLAELFTAVQAIQGGGGGTPAACFAGFSGAPGLTGTLLIAGLPGQGGNVASEVFAVESTTNVFDPGPNAVVVSPLRVVKARDANTPRLFRAATFQIHFPTVTINMTDANGTVAFTYVLSDVLVTLLRSTTVYRCDGTTVSADEVVLTCVKTKYTDTASGNSWEWNSVTRTGSGT